MPNRPALVGRSMVMWRSKRPGRNRAGSSTSGRLVAAIDDDRFGLREPVHFAEDLVEGLLAFVVPAAHAGSAHPADGVDLIDENDAGGVLLGSAEQIPHAAGAHADEHLNELRAVDRIKRHAGFSGRRAGQQRFPGARWPDQQHALGDLAPSR